MTADADQAVSCHSLVYLFAQQPDYDHSEVLQLFYQPTN